MFDGNSPFTECTPSFTRATGGFFTYANGTTYFNRLDNLGIPQHPHCWNAGSATCRHRILDVGEGVRAYGATCRAEGHVVWIESNTQGCVVVLFVSCWQSAGSATESGWRQEAFHSSVSVAGYLTSAPKLATLRKHTCGTDFGTHRLFVGG